jgi:hypothetical protein
MFDRVSPFPYSSLLSTEKIFPPLCSQSATFPRLASGKGDRGSFIELILNPVFFSYVIFRF